MTRMRKLTIAVVVVAAVALLVAGTSYARSAPSPNKQVDSIAGCDDAIVADLHSTMWSSLAGGLGMTTEQLNRAVAEGKTPDDLAREKGIDRAQLSDRMFAAAKAALQDEVKNGALSGQQAESLLESAKSHMGPEHVAAMVGETGSTFGKLGADGVMLSMHEGTQEAMDAMDESGHSCDETQAGGEMMPEAGEA